MSDYASLLSRRALLKGLSSGFGYIAFAGLSTLAAAADRDRKAVAARARGRPLPGEGQAGDLPLHARGTFARRHVRLQAPAHGRHRQALANRPGSPAPSCSVRPGSSTSTARAASGSPSCSPRSPRMPTSSASIRSMHTDLPAHPQAYLMMHTGNSQFVRPSLGAWTLYGLGTENENLPGFIAIKPVARNGGPQNYGSAFLPAIYQGTRIGNEVAPVANAQLGNIKNPRLDVASQRLQLDLVQSMNRELLEREQVHPGVEGVIESYELAFRMQGSLPEVMDLAKESDGDQEPVRHRRRGDRRLRPPVPAGAGGSSRRACGSSS